MASDLFAGSDVGGFYVSKGRYVQDYTLSEAFAPAQTFDIPAFGGKLDISWNPRIASHAMWRARLLCVQSEDERAFRLAR